MALYFAARDNLRLETRPPTLCLRAVEAGNVDPISIHSAIPCQIEGEEARLLCELSLPFLDIGGHANPILRAQLGDLMHPSLVLDRVMWSNGGASNPHVHEHSHLPSDLESLLKLMKQHPAEHQRGARFRPLRKVSLPSSEAPKLLEYLDVYGINGATIYPGLSGIADSAKERAHDQHIDRQAEVDELVARLAKKQLLFDVRKI